MLNDKGVMTRIRTVERRVLKGSLHAVHAIHALFTSHHLEWMARSVGRYSEELVREFYSSYITTLWESLDRRSNPAKQAPLSYVLVRGHQVDISLPTIHCFLYGTDIDASRAPSPPI